MTSLQKVGGYAALLQGVNIAVLFVFLLVLLPGQGFPVVVPGQSHPETQQAVYPTIGPPGPSYIVVAITTLLIVLALYERLRAGAPSTIAIATASGLVAVALFLGGGMMGFLSGTAFARFTNTTVAGTAAVALDQVVGGLLLGAVFAVGWWILLTSWASLRTGALPKGLNYLGFLAGVQGILTLLMPLIPLLAIPLLPLMWVVWLGIVLLREPASMTAPTR